MAKHKFRNLLVWEKSRALVKEVSELTVNFPNEEKFGLISQLRRAVISISSNISEGSGRGSDKDFSRFLDMAEGSANEVINLLVLSYDLNLILKDELNSLIEKIEEVIKMINGFRKKIND
jgi:four helix bundle protein